MATLNIGGHKVNVDDGFAKLSPEQQNATVEEIASSLGAVPSLKDRFKADTAAIADAAPKVGQGESFGRGAVQGATYNFSDEAMGASAAGTAGLPEEAKSAINLLGKFLPQAELARIGVGILRQIGDKAGVTGGDATAAYDMTAGIERAKNHAAEEQNPGTYLAGSVAGGLATAPLTPGGGALQAGNIAARVGQGAKYGAAYGALAGAGAGEGTADTIGKTIVGGGIGAATGGAISGAFGPRVVGNGQEVLEAAGRLGVEVPKGVATDSRALQAVTQASRQIPFFGSRVEGAIAKTGEGLEEAVDTGVSRLSGVTGGREAVGSAARQSLERGIEKLDTRADAAFSRLRGAIDANADVPLDNGVVQSVDKIMQARAAAGADGIPMDGLKNVIELATRPEGASFNGLQRARSDIGKAIKWDQRNGGFMAGDLKQAYGALSDAMEDVVRKTARGDPDNAARLLLSANDTFGKVVGETKELSRFLANGSDERIVDRIISYGSEKAGRGDLAKLNMLRRSMDADEWNNVSALALDRMGRNQAGEFSTAFFTKNYNQMAPAAKDAMFGRTGSNTRQWIDDISTVSNRMNEAGRAANFSNTARGVMTGAGVLGGSAYAFNDPVNAMQDGLKTAAVAVPIVYFLARPATAASMSRWSHAYENIVQKPTTAALASFNIASRNLANQMGEAAGIKIDPSAFLKLLQGPATSRAQDQQRPPGQPPSGN